MPVISWGSAIVREFLRSSWPGGFIRTKAAWPGSWYPTERAKAALPEIRQVLGQWESWVTQDLTEAERRSLELLLGKLKARAAARIGQD